MGHPAAKTSVDRTVSDITPNQRDDEEQALQRAAVAARRLAAQTGTPLVVLREGLIAKIEIDLAESKPATLRKD